MQVESIAECSSVFLTCIKVPHVFKTFVLSIFEWLLKTGPTVMAFSCLKLANFLLSLL